MFLGKFTRLLDAAARREREHHFAARRLDAQGVAPRLGVALELHRDHLLFEGDSDHRRLAGAAHEQGAKRQGHGASRNQGIGRVSLWHSTGPSSFRHGPKDRSRTPAVDEDVAGFRVRAFSAPRNDKCAYARFLPPPWPPLCDSMKSTKRGWISERKREPLNTP